MTAEEITRLLDDITARLEGPGRYIFDLTVRQVFISGLVTLIGSLIVIALVLSLDIRVIRWVRRPMDSPDPFRPPSMDMDIVIVLTVLGTILFGGFAFLLAGDALIDLLAPEYAALERILGFLK